MIQQAETLIKYGYLPIDLSHGSEKPILAICDECSKVRETSKNHYYPLCNSCAHEGQIPWNLGIKATEEAKVNMSVARKGRKRKPFTEEHKANMSTAMKGKKRKPFTEEHKVKVMKNLIHKKGADNPTWKGGISFEPYCVKFNNAFKEYIRAKFGYTCFLCPITQTENGKKLSVHHVNYNKNCGCDGDKTCNFVPLCVRCHAKTNGNRDYWQKIITDKLHRTIIGWDV